MQTKADYSQQHKENKDMVSKKLLTIQECQFNLPDDFDGTLGDALMLLAKKRLEAESKNKINRENNDSDCYTTLVNNDDIKCSIKYALCKLSEDGTKWESL